MKPKPKAKDLLPGTTIRYRAGDLAGAERTVDHHLDNAIEFTNGRFADHFWLDETADFEIISDTEPDYVW